MSRLRTKIREARLIVARSAGTASELLDTCARSGWLALVSQHAPSFSAADIARLAVSLYAARERYVNNGSPLKQWEAYDRQLRVDLRKSIKLLREAEKTAGLFADAISAIRAGMQSEVTTPPLFDDYVARAKNGSPDDRSQAKRTAGALLEQFCPRKFLKNAELAREVKIAADELLRSLGFDVKVKTSKLVGARG